MGRRGTRGLCGRCGGPKKGNRAARSQPVADCAICLKPICQRHATWADDRWVCTKCARAPA